MTLEKALTIKEETVRKCLNYFNEIHKSPFAIAMREASNRKSAAEREQGVKDGDKYYENSDKKTFFNDLNRAIGQIQNKDIKSKFTEYLKAYLKNAPDDNYRCDVNGISKIKRKVDEQNYAAQNSNNVFNPWSGEFSK